MSRRKHSPSDLVYQRWIKEGRGQGRMHTYRPWLTVRDVPSRGRSHRIFGFKSQRTHHLFSDLELAAFFILEWHPYTQEIREQYPLQREITREISRTTGIKHPSFAGVDQYMSTDFLVNTSKAELPKFAVQVKRSEDLNSTRTIEKLEIERQYWKQKDIPWFLLTEREIPVTVSQNIEWLYPAQTEDISYEKLALQLNFYTQYFFNNPTTTLIDISKLIDMDYCHLPGETLKELRLLLAKRFITFDIRKNYRELTGSDLTFSSSEILESISASS